MSTYSFLDVSATITGPGGSFSIGSSAGVAEEGITISKKDKNTQTEGADGAVMNTLHANENGTITVRLLKTSNANALLSAMYNFQKSTAANWGQNVIVVTNVVSGDLATGTGCAFAKHPDITHAKEAGIVEWEFHSNSVNENLGTW